MRLLNLLIGDYMHKDSIFALVEDTVSALGFILIECAVHYGKTKDSLRIVIYSKDRKITSDDCTGVADIVSRQLDIDDPFDRPYDLIVESPGLERELKSQKEYEYFTGRELKIFLNEDSEIVPKEGFIVSVLKNADDDGIEVQLDKDMVRLPYHHIKKAKLYCDYEKLLKKNK